MSCCVSRLLLLCLLFLAALHPFAATAHRELPMAKANGHEEAKRARTEMAAAEESATGKEVQESSKWQHFKTRKLPSDAKNRFDGRVPFTADYGDVQSHPSKHH